MVGSTSGTLGPPTPVPRPTFRPSPSFKTEYLESCVGSSYPRVVLDQLAPPSSDNKNASNGLKNARETDRHLR